MSRRARDKRWREHAGQNRAEWQAEQRLIDALRQFQLASGGVMLVGLTLAAVVCAGEFQQPWLIAAGGAVFLLGLVFYGVARGLARWWTTRR